jgi:hypothetical protein
MEQRGGVAFQSTTEERLMAYLLDAIFSLIAIG